MSLIIDCHVHLNQYEDLPPKSLEQRVQDLRNEMHENGVDHAVILSSYLISETRPSTEQIIDAISMYDNLSVVAGYSIDNHDFEYLHSCRKWLKEGVVKGMKLYCGYEHYYPSDPRYQHVYQMCTEFDVPVMFHAGDTFSSKGKVKYSHPINLDEIAVDNPELKIVICHLGNPWIDDCMELVYKNKNMFADISGLVLGEFTDDFEKLMTLRVMELLNYAGRPRYLLYGTDWPLASMKSYLSFVSKLNLSDDSYDLMMHRNSRELFRI